MSANQSMGHLSMSNLMRHFFTCLIISLFISSASHAAILSVGDGLKILAIDGRVITENNSLPAEVQKGKRQLVIRYDNSLNENHDVRSNMQNVSSSPYIFFVDINQDTQISVQKFRIAFQARSAIRRGLVFTIENEQGQKRIDNADKLHGNGANPFSPVNLKPLIENYNQAHGIRYQ
jgi:uncharacterized protein YccT (UPF0319 family)